jgi:hypothetical protein
LRTKRKLGLAVIENAPAEVFDYRPLVVVGENRYQANHGRVVDYLVGKRDHPGNVKRDYAVLGMGQMLVADCL